MPYVNDNNGNGKHPGFLGEVATEYAAQRLGAISPLVSAAMRVIRSRQVAAPAPVPVALPRPTIDTARRVVATTTRYANTVPVVNVTTLPNGTAVPTPGGAATPPPSNNGAGPSYRGPGVTDPSQLPDFTGGGSGGPPAYYPEVGTLDDGGDSNISTAGVSNALAGLTSSKPLLAGIALLAFFMLDGKPKRRRR